MKKILYSVALAACCMGTMTSCSDFLDASNKSNVTDKQTFATKEGFNSLVNDAYQHPQNVYAASLFTSCFSAGTDMYADGRNKMNEALNTYEILTPENEDITDLYTYLYAGIRAANSVSYYAQTAQVDDKTKGQLVGEARVLAAYEYYLLVNNFGGVPIMKGFLTTADTGYPKSSAQMYMPISSANSKMLSARMCSRLLQLPRVAAESARKQPRLSLPRPTFLQHGTSTSRNTSPRQQPLPMR